MSIAKQAQEHGKGTPTVWWGLPLVVWVILSVTALLILVMVCLAPFYGMHEDAKIANLMAWNNPTAANQVFQRLRRSERLSDRRGAYEAMGLALAELARAGRPISYVQVCSYFGTPDWQGPWPGGLVAYGFVFDRYGQKDAMLAFAFRPGGNLVEVGLGAPKYGVTGTEAATTQLGEEGGGPATQPEE